MNIFYAPPPQIHESLIELKGQEAVHASKVLRYGKDDDIIVVDGQGTYYEGMIRCVSNDFVQIETTLTKRQKQPKAKLAVGIIKKQSRLEFIVEKAVELGIREINFFRGEHSVKQNVRRERLTSVAISAMKQSLQAWLPGIHQFESLHSVIDHHSACNFIAGRQSADKTFTTAQKNSNGKLLLVGPEGGFSAEEFALLQNHQTDFVGLGPNRLRTETAALSMLVQFSSF